MKTYRIRCRSAWTVDVPIPDGLTHDEVDDLIAAAVDEQDDDAEWDAPPGYVYAPPPDLPGEPPAEAWVTVDGHRWATNGAILIREDCPRPLSVPPLYPWHTHRRPADIQALLSDLIAIGRPSRYDARYEPILLAGDVTESSTRAYVVVGGDLIAIVASLNTWAGSNTPSVGATS